MTLLYFMDLDSVSVHKHAKKKNLANIRPSWSRSVNNTCIYITSSNRRWKSELEFWKGLVSVLKKQNSRNSILCLSCLVDVKLASLQQGRKQMNWSKSKCVREGLFSFIHVLGNIRYNRSAKNTDCSQWTAFVFSNTTKKLVQEETEASKS